MKNRIHNRHVQNELDTAIFTLIFTISAAIASIVGESSNAQPFAVVTPPTPLLDNISHRLWVLGVIFLVATIFSTRGILALSLRGPFLSLLGLI
jgi:hypothetical protein